MIKNAIAYITRKRNRTLIIFIILTIVLSCLYSCLTIMKSSNEIEKALYESSNSSISITKKDGKYFNVNQFKDIEKIKKRDADEWWKNWRSICRRNRKSFLVRYL